MVFTMYSSTPPSALSHFSTPFRASKAILKAEEARPLTSCRMGSPPLHPRSWHECPSSWIHRRTSRHFTRFSFEFIRFASFLWLPDFNFTRLSKHFRRCGCTACATLFWQIFDPNLGSFSLGEDLQELILGATQACFTMFHIPFSLYAKSFHLARIPFAALSSEMLDANVTAKVVRATMQLSVRLHTSPHAGCKRMLHFI